MQPVIGVAPFAPCRPGDLAERPGAQCPPRFDGGELAWFALVAFLPLAWIFLHRQPCTWDDFFSVIVHAVALTFWAVRLRYAGLGLGWASLTLLGLSSAFATNPSGRLDTSAMGEAVFLFLLLSLFSAYDRQPGLQALAGAALLLSAGVLTKPPIAISCLLVSLAFFAIYWHRTRSGAFSFALLMFTPVTLCAASAGLIAFLTRGTLNAPVLVPVGSLFQTGLSAPTYAQLLSAHLSGGTAMRWLALPAAVVLYRLSINRTAACDVAFGFILTAAAVLSLFPQMPDPLHRVDMFYLALGGTAALLVQSPPQRYLGSLLACTGLLLSMHACL
jgi:hypothetical protein